jgi:hypothetical protein
MRTSMKQKKKVGSEKKTKAVPSPRTQSAPLRFLTQAKESLKILQTLERETLAKARTLVRNPLPGNRRQLTNERILASLRKIGVAPQSEVDALKARIERLEAALKTGKRPVRQEIPLS